MDKMNNVDIAKKIFDQVTDTNKWRYIVNEVTYRIKKDYHDPRDIVWIVQSFLLRGARGWSDTDYWNANEYIALTTKNVLRHLREDLQGHPDDISQEEWEAYVDKMITAFETLYAHTHDDVALPEHSKHDVAVGLYLFERYYTSLWS